MNKRKYPTSLFFIGFIMNVFFRFSWLFVPGLILVLTGFFVRACLYIGLAFIVFDVAVSLIEQILIRRAFLKDSDNPEFSEFQDALSGDGNWRNNVAEILNQKISNSKNEITLDEKNKTNKKQRGCRKLKTCDNPERVRAKKQRFFVF